jgi:hypothetical protein
MIVYPYFGIIGEETILVFLAKVLGGFADNNNAWCCV